MSVQQSGIVVYNEFANKQYIPSTIEKCKETS